MSSPAAYGERASSARVQGAEQLGETTTTTPAAAAQQAPPAPPAPPAPSAPALEPPEPPVLYQDALFLFIAEGRIPSRTEMLVFALGFVSMISLVFITSDLMNSKALRPWYVLVFMVTSSYFGVLVWSQRVAVAEYAAEEVRLAAEARSPPSRIIDKETRRRLLDYFVFRPPEEEKKVETNNGSSSYSSTAVGGFKTMMAKIDGRLYNDDDEERRKSDTLGSSGRGLRFSLGSSRGGGSTPGINSSTGSSGRIFGGVFSLLPSRAAASSSPASPPAEATTLPLPPDASSLPPTGAAGETNAGDGNAEGRSSGDPEEGGLAALPADSRRTGRGSEDEPRGQAAAATVAAAAAAASATVAKDSSEGGREGCGCSPTTGNAEATGGDKAGGEWSTAESCIVCFGDYAYGDELCRLPCRHLYHATCIDEWLDGANHSWCPLCKTDVVAGAAPARPANSNNTS